MKKLSAVLVLLVVLGSRIDAIAFDEWQPFTQPDGTTFTAHVFGDPFSISMFTADGYAFQPAALDKIQSLCAEIERRCLDVPVGIDGGVHPGNAAACRQAGAQSLVAGSAVFGAQDPARVIADLRG